MDPLEKLQKRNEKHNGIQESDKKEILITFPLALVLAAIGILSYFSLSFYLMGEDIDLFNLDFRGMAKNVWVLAMIMTLGCGAIFFVMSISIIIWFHLFAQELGRQVRVFGVFRISTTFLLVSSIFFFMGRWLNGLILENRREISQFLNFGYNQAPTLLEMFSTYFTMGLAVLMLQGLYKAIKIPFNAKSHAEKHLTSN